MWPAVPHQTPLPAGARCLMPASMTGEVSSCCGASLGEPSVVVTCHVATS